MSDDGKIWHEFWIEYIENACSQQNLSGGMTMKKAAISIVLIGCLGFFALQPAHAGRGRNVGTGPDCPAWNGGYGQFQKGAAQKDIDAFLLATVELRKNLAMKQAEYHALMNSATPDPTRAAAISGEMFELRDQLRLTAKDAGLGNGYGRGCYPGGGRGGYGFGPGGGRGGNGFGPGGGRGCCNGFIN
jgi:hypothetical protein